jgi:hypothetical protein
MVRLLSLAGALSVACLQYDYQPLPMPTARIDGIGPCVGCVARDAVVVSLSGDDAVPGALVAVYDTRRMHALGQRPSAAARADGEGRWRLTLRALHDAGQRELPVHQGDLLGVIQRLGPDGPASAPYHVTIPVTARDEELPVFVEVPAPPGRAESAF